MPKRAIAEKERAVADCQREREAKEVALRDARRAKQARATAEEHVKDLIEQVRQHERRGHRAHAALAEIIGRPD